MNQVNIINLLKWILTRVGILYVAWFLLAPHIVDFTAISERIKVKRLNDTRPDFSALVTYHEEHSKLNMKDADLYQRYFEMVVHYVGDDPIAEHALGFANLTINNNKKAVEELEAVSARVPVLFWPDYNLGVYYYRQGQFNKAADHLNKAINVPPNVVMKLMVDSIIYRQILASKAFKSSLVMRIQQARMDASVLLLAALEHIDADQAMMSMSLQIINDGSQSASPAVYYYAGLAAFKLKRYDKALVLFEKNIALDGKKPWSYLWLARLFDAAGDSEKAKEYLKAFSVLKESQPQLLRYDQEMDYKIF